MFKLVIQIGCSYELNEIFVYVMTISQKTYGSNSWLEDSISSAWSGVMTITMIIPYLPKFWSCGRLKVPKLENGQCKPWYRTISWYRHKVHIFWEGHKMLRNLHLTFDYSTYSQRLGEDFAKFCGLLRIYELYRYISFISISIHTCKPNISCKILIAPLLANTADLRVNLGSGFSLSGHSQTTLTRWGR